MNPNCRDCHGDGGIEVLTCGTSRCKCDGFSGGCSEFERCHCNPEEEPDWDNMRDDHIDLNAEVEWESPL